MNKTWADTVTVLHQRAERYPNRFWYPSSFPWPSNLVERELELGVTRGEVERRRVPGSSDRIGYRYKVTSERKP